MTIPDGFTVQAVDLAARKSAVCIMEWPTYSIIDQWHPRADWGNIAQFATVLASSNADVTVIEDLPPIRSFQLSAKQACQHQGRIFQAFEELGRLHKIQMLQPLKWMKWLGYPGKKSKRNPDGVASTEGWAKQVCLEEYDYKPPGDITGKLLQDYRDAYLIARYSLEKANEDGVNTIGVKVKD